MQLSVIIPTRNGANRLGFVLESLIRQSLPYKHFETLVVDNGSSDETRKLVDFYLTDLPNLRYLCEKKPGLHACRHKGFEECGNDILVYADDDIEASATWLEGISETFKDKNVALVGGKNVPKFESEPPGWLLDMWCAERNGNRTLSYLSILDLGNKKKEIPAQYVFGCNFSIRKSVLLDAGGFHPDAFPKHLIKYRGDGETHVSNYMQSKKLKTVYNPKASVHHWVPKERMTVEYFSYRAYIQGISDSYTAVRRIKGRIHFHNHKVVGSKAMFRLRDMIDSARQKAPDDILRLFYRKISASFAWGNSDKALIKRKINRAYKAGYAFHQDMLRKDPNLLEWALRSDYFGKNGKFQD